MIAASPIAAPCAIGGNQRNRGGKGHLEPGRNDGRGRHEQDHDRGERHVAQCLCHRAGQADQGDDNADKWSISVADGGTMTLNRIPINYCILKFNKRTLNS